MIVLLVLLLALGGACLFFANLVQRTALRMMGQPRNRLAEWASKVASSRTSRLSIRASGALCIAAAFVLWLASSRSSARAEATMHKLASGVVWRSVLELDLDGDGRVDFVLLGKTPSEAVLGVVFGASRPSPVVLRFRRDAASQGGVCGDPGDAQISVEDLSAPDDPDDDSPAEARAPAGSLRKGFRLDSGDCDAFHFFFNGKGVTWWRR